MLDHVLERLAPLDLPAKDHFESYLRHKWRANHKPKTIEGSFTSIMLFLTFYEGSGKSDITQIGRSDLEAFIEHEQDRGINISTVKTRMASIVAFLHFLMDQDVLPLSALEEERSGSSFPTPSPGRYIPRTSKRSSTSSTIPGTGP